MNFKIKIILKSFPLHKYSALTNYLKCQEIEMTDNIFIPLIIKKNDIYRKPME